MALFDIFSSLASGAGSIFTGLLGSNQVQSVVRTGLKIAGGLMLAKYGVDAGSLESIVGGFMAAIGVVSSIKTHMPTGGPSITDLAKEIAVTAAQAAATAALQAMAQQNGSQPANPTQTQAPAAA